MSSATAGGTETASQPVRVSVDDPTDQQPAITKVPSSRRNSTRRGSVYSVRGPVDPKQAPDGAGPQPRTNSAGKTVPVACVVGSVTALIVIVVVSVTFAITYTTSVDAVERIGISYAKALVAAARVRTEDLFDRPTSLGLAMRNAGRRPHMVMPKDDPSDFGVLRETLGMVLATQISIGRTVPSLAVIFDDGSQAATRFHNDSILVVHMSNGRTLTAGAPGAPLFGAIIDVVDYHWPSMVPTAEPVSDRVLATGDARIGGYDLAKQIVSLRSPGFWTSPTYFDSTGTPFFSIPMAVGLRNASDMDVGLIVISVSLDEAGNFLRQLTLTENSHMFILDEIATAVAATTHPAPFVTLESTTDRDYIPPANCATSALSASSSQTNFTIACRTRARDFPYPPLRVASRLDALVEPTSAEVFFNGTLEADGEQYYAAAAKVANDLRSFGLSLLLLMPQKDVLGDIVRSRNIVIGIVVAVLLVAVATSSLVIALVMRPLRQVASKMRQTARLNETVDDGETSRLSEVAALQNSYRRMDVAIKNFTKYVPRDVVKDLMKTNQLCLIEMEPKACTMLFVDIAGFTSMCERVPPDALSGLVSKYFEIMSSLVMGHSGLIDKFIGDCIMAVWGAPFDVPSKAARATLCGLRMDRETRVDPLLSAFDAEGEQLSIRVGVASGEVLAGNMGSAERMNYTVIGDAVNLASRIEALNKQFGTRVSICNTTAQDLKSLFVLRALANVAVVGKKDGVLVHEVVGISADIAASDLIQFRAEHDRAYADITDTDDSMSHVSFRTADSGAAAAGNGRGGQVVNVMQLLDQARILRNCPLVATPAQAKFAQRFTDALQAYIAGDFVKAAQHVAPLADLELSAKATVDNAAHSTPPPGAVVPATGNATGDGSGSDKGPLSTTASDIFDATLQGSLSVELLRSLVQKAVADPPADMHQWDGIWHAESK